MYYISKFIGRTLALFNILIINLPTIYKQFLLRANGYSFLTRLQAFNILIEIIKVSPLFGLGPANYYWFTLLFPILGWYVRFNSHNQYVDIMAQSGILGFRRILPWPGMFAVVRFPPPQQEPAARDRGQDR